jgi:transcriptional regulator with XRE-family HTH domain
MDDVKWPANANVCRSVDQAVGQQIERALLLRDVSMAQLADLANVPLDELQACCAGVQRLSATALCDVARALRVPVSYFFDPLLRIKP